MSVRSPSGASVCVTVSALFATGMLSPVSADSATSSVAALSSRPSAGTTSPASIATTSPGTSCSAGTWTSSPPRRTLALTIIIFWSAATAAAAFPSWLRPRTALNRVRKSRTSPVPSSCSGQMLPMPATSRTICIGSRYWRTNARQRGSPSVATNAFGPYCSSRFAASSEARPACVSTPSSPATSSPLNANHCLSSFAAWGAGAVVAIVASLGDLCWVECHRRAGLATQQGRRVVDRADRRDAAGALSEHAGRAHFRSHRALGEVELRQLARRGAADRALVGSAPAGVDGVDVGRDDHRVGLQVDGKQRGREVLDDHRLDADQPAARGHGLVDVHHRDPATARADDDAASLEQPLERLESEDALRHRRRNDTSEA